MKTAAHFAAVFFAKVLFDFASNYQSIFCVLLGAISRFRLYLPASASQLLSGYRLYRG